MICPYSGPFRYRFTFGVNRKMMMAPSASHVLFIHDSSHSVSPPMHNHRLRRHGERSGAAPEPWRMAGCGQVRPELEKDLLFAMVIIGASQ